MTIQRVHNRCAFCVTQPCASKETTLSQLGKMLAVEKHVENFAFVDEKTTCIEARRMFEKIRGRNKRLSVIFITNTGSRDEPLLGMLTPWDVMQDIGTQMKTRKPRASKRTKETLANSVHSRRKTTPHGKRSLMRCFVLFYVLVVGGEARMFASLRDFFHRRNVSEGGHNCSYSAREDSGSVI